MSGIRNRLLDSVEYQVETTRLGTWRRFMYPNGQVFAEYRSHGRLFGLPLVHYTSGISPETGRRITARGILAIGRVAVGVIAVGQAAVGILALGQLAIGLIFALGQGAIGSTAVGQLGFGLRLGVGQVATGSTAIGQLAYGEHVLAQAGVGAHVWDQRGTDPAARAHFEAIWSDLRTRLGDAAR